MLPSYFSRKAEIGCALREAGLHEQHIKRRAEK